VLSANVFNNGICAHYETALRHRCLAEFEGLSAVNSFFNKALFKRKTLRAWQGLCVSKEFFELSHQFFFEGLPHYKSKHLEMIHQPTANILSGVSRRTYKAKFSINAIGFNFATLLSISDALGLYQGMNDEGVISQKFSIEICPWFRCSHFHFADQRAQLSDAEELYWLSRYKRLTVDPS
jgi:hypothetical protein